MHVYNRIEYVVISNYSSMLDSQCSVLDLNCLRQILWNSFCLKSSYVQEESSILNCYHLDLLVCYCCPIALVSRAERTKMAGLYGALVRRFLASKNKNYTWDKLYRSIHASSDNIFHVCVSGDVFFPDVGDGIGLLHYHRKASSQ